MQKVPQKIVHNHYLRHRKKFPHVWCPGCSNGIVLGNIIRAVNQLGWKRSNTAMVSGIGCSSRMPVYVDFNTLHTLHGRAIAFATGIKMQNPKMDVMVVTGDGDATAIGGNHFIHAARRNINLSVILINNHIYGMTGGQYSPTTPTGDKATTTPYGNIDPVFDICELALGAGATFVARSTAFHSVEAQNFIRKALSHKGFSIVEIISACPVIYGRLNKKGTAPDMMREMKDNVIPIKAFDKLTEEQKKGKVQRGIFREIEKPEYTDEYEKLIQSIAKEQKK